MSRSWKVCATTAAFLTLTGSAILADASSQRAASDQNRPASYVGCLRGDYGSFELTEVGGPDVPETRNWRTFYVTKMRELQVVPSGRVDLQTHVGTTVRITGDRDGDTLHARSITFVGSTCK
jgi:hypothetical protein